jgi:enamine deaminase RidA (YjgF/YER057c/UK114 family)
MASIRRIFADGRLEGSGPYSDAVVIEGEDLVIVRLAGIAGVDPVTHSVVGYEAHNGTYAPDALEQQVGSIFAQAERLLAAASEQTGTDLTMADLTEAVCFLREDFPLTVQRFNDAYVEEFARRGIGDYPARTTILGVTLPEPNALVEIRFEAAVAR